MILSLALAALFGAMLGYFVIGPVNRTYTAMQYGIIVGILTFMVGLLFLAALVLGYFFFPSENQTTSNNPLLGTLTALAAWGSYAAAVGVGSYLQQRLAGR